MRLDDDVVAKALSQVGEPSLVVVSEISKDTDSGTRRRAVLILINMNLPSSRKMLKDHLDKETDERIRYLIDRNLKQAVLSLTLCICPRNIIIT